MKLKIIAIAVLSMLAIGVAGNAALSSTQDQIPKESKEQPAKVKLATDSVDDKWGEVAFDHTNHANRTYNTDVKSVAACVDCHHTDQPKENLKPPLVTSERAVLLTTDSLKEAAAAPVKACRSCHLQAGDDSKPLPVIKKDDKDLKIDNEVAYHRNCFTCHDAAIKLNPALAAKIAGSDPKGCAKCHVAK